MKSNGWIKLHRSILDWEWYDETNTFKVFLHCLLRANHKDKNWRGQTIKVGSFITSYSNLAVECKLSTQQIRTALDKLKHTKELTIKTTNKYTVVTICKYESYQVLENENNKQITIKQQTNNKQITTNNNDNNIIKDIIAVLNEKTNKSFRAETAKTKNVIKARLNEDFTYEDFITVINNKSKDWKDDPKMSKFLRPETLFGNKFEGYLNETAKKEVKKRTPVWDGTKYVLQ